MKTLHCPDCGAECLHVGTSGMENQWCFTCPSCKCHWVRYFGHIEFWAVARCEICNTPEDEA